MRSIASFDVVVPCYNYGHFLNECVTSILTQEEVDVRVLIIDDCSPDNTETVGRQLAAEDSRVEYRRHVVNKGHIATYNEGLLEWADSTYCVLLSADDLLAPGALRRAVRIMDANPRVTFCHGDVVRDTFSVPRELGALLEPSYTIVPGTEYVRACCAVGGNRVQTPTAVARTEVQVRAGGYDPRLPHAGDMEMWLRLASYGDVARINAIQAVYRLHGGNMSLPYYAGTGDMEQRLAVFESFFKRCHERIPDWQELRRLSMRALSMQAFWSASQRFDDGDSSGCRGLLSLSARIWPSVRRTSEWRRFAIRRALGRTGTSWLRSLRGNLSHWIPSRVGAKK